MPVMTSKDSEGCFARWGDEGHKYYYKCGDEESRKEAKRKALKQGQAIKAKEQKN